MHSLSSSSNRTYNLTGLGRHVPLFFTALEQKRTTHLNHLLDTITETKTVARQIFEDLMQQAKFDLVLIKRGDIGAGIGLTEFSIKTQ